MLQYRQQVPGCLRGRSSCQGSEIENCIHERDIIYKICVLKKRFSAGADDFNKMNFFSGFGRDDKWSSDGRVAVGHCRTRHGFASLLSGDLRQDGFGPDGHRDTMKFAMIDHLQMSVVKMQEGGNRAMDWRETPALHG